LCILQRRNSRGARSQLRTNNELQLDSMHTPLAPFPRSAPATNVCNVRSIVIPARDH
jgi:hypothetical protein